MMGIPAAPSDVGTARPTVDASPLEHPGGIIRWPAMVVAKTESLDPNGSAFVLLIYCSN
jgi:hypothetical protein